MNSRYVHFIGDSNSPTCPEVPGGKVKNFVPTIGLCRHIVGFDLIWRDLTVFLLSVTLEPTVCMGEINGKLSIYQECSKEHSDEIYFLKFHPTVGRNSQKLAEGQNHCWRYCTFPATFKHFFLRCRPKMIMDTHSIKFVAGCSAPFGCNLS